MAPIHIPQSEKKTYAERAALIFEDEASFRQDSTLYQTWAPIGSQPQIPVTGQRKSVKIFGAVEVYTARFIYHRAKVFNAVTYLEFLDQLARCYYPKRTHLIQDNASYHKDAADIFALFVERYFLLFMRVYIEDAVCSWPAGTRLSSRLILVGIACG